MTPAIRLTAAAMFGLAAAAYAAPPAATYVMKAGASDMYEQQSSKLVLASTKDAKVRGFANDMIRDHAKSTADIKAAAMKGGMKPAAPKLEPKQADMIRQLTAATGQARDTLYWQQQKAAHAEALALHSDYAKTGDTPALKTTAGKIVPVVRHHADMLNGMKM